MFYSYLFFALLTFKPAAAQCFTRRSGTISVAPGMHSCNNTELQTGGAQQCCNGVDDGTCGTDRLCKNRKGQYYVGGCTDSTYTDPVCRSECTWYLTTWIDWVPAEKQWHCCTVNSDGSNGCNSGRENVTFNAVAPGAWESVLTSNKSSTGGSSTQATGSAAQDDNTLSSGAAIGIGVAAALGGVAVLAGGFWLFKFLRRRKQARNGEDTGLMEKAAPGGYNNGVAVEEPYRNELGTTEGPKELHTGQYVRELPA